MLIGLNWVLYSLMTNANSISPTTGWKHDKIDALEIQWKGLRSELQAVGGYED